MQCNPQLPFFVSGPPNCSQFYPCPQNFNQPQLQQFQPLCNSAQYPDVIGEGEVVSVVLADGTVQLYFMPTTNWTNCMRNTNHNQGWNQNTGAWFVRSINNPPCPQYPSQNNLPSCGARNYNTPALPPCQGFQMKFHNDQCTSTGDIEYFFPRLRTCDVTPRSCAGVQAAVPEKTSCFGMVCDAPCHCRTECSGARRPIYTGHVSYGDTKCDSDMSIEETSCRGSKRRKGQTDCECHRGSSNSSEGRDRKRQKKCRRRKPHKNSFSQTSSAENCQSSGSKHKPCKNLEKERKAWEKERKKQETERKKQEQEWKKKEKEFDKKLKQFEKKREKVRLEKEKKEKKEQGKKSASSQSDDEFDDYSDSCTCSVCTSSVCRTMSGLSGRISCSNSFMSLGSRNSDSQDKTQKQLEKEQRKIKKEQEKQLKKEQKQLEKALKEQEKKFRKQLQLEKKAKDKTRKDSKDSIEDGKNGGECSCFAPLPVDDYINTNSVPLESCCCDTGLKIVDCMEGTKYDVGSLCVCPPTSDKILATNSEQSNNSYLDLMMKGLEVGYQNCMPPDNPCSPSRDYISSNSNNSISPNTRPV